VNLGKWGDSRKEKNTEKERRDCLGKKEEKKYAKKLRFGEPTPRPRANKQTTEWFSGVGQKAGGETKKGGKYKNTSERGRVGGRQQTKLTRNNY